jgi:hypothetical protein
MMASPRPPDAVLPNWLVVGFSGHRHLDNAGVVDAAIRRVLDDLARRNPRLVGVSSAALGADTLFAEEMLRRHCPLRIVLPFPVARFERDFTGDPDAWARSLAVVRAAIDVDLVQQATRDDEGAGTPRADAAEDGTSLDGTPQAAYMEAGLRTVDRSDVLIAVWDGKPVKGLGGTGDVVEYARAIGRPVVLVDPATGVIAEDGVDRLPRRTGEVTPEDVARPRALVERYYDAVNRQAEHDAPVARGLMRTCVWLHLAASSLAGGALVFGARGSVALAVGGVDAVLLGLAFGMLWVRGRRHRTWRRLRAEAEVCRSALATWEIRRHERPGHAPRVPLPGLAALSGTLELLRELDRSPYASIDDARSAYAKGRIQDQIDYFARKGGLAHRQVRRRKILMTVFTTIGIGSAVGSAAAILLGSAGPIFAEWLDFLGVVAPLAASALGVLLITDESARRNDRYAQMVAVLQTALPRLQAARTWASLNRVATVVEEELLQELLEWRAFVRHTEHVQ